jgi:hypothetical protein
VHDFVKKNRPVKDDETEDNGGRKADPPTLESPSSRKGEKEKTELAKRDKEMPKRFLPMQVAKAIGFDRLQQAPLQIAGSLVVRTSLHPGTLKITSPRRLGDP